MINDAVVLGGDYSAIKQIDGELSLIINHQPVCDLINILDGDADLVQQADGDLSLIEILDGQFGVVTEIHGGAYPSYTGQTIVTPSNETQTLNTKDTSVLSNITINPIPNNYGLITWDGSTLTVS